MKTKILKTGITIHLHCNENNQGQDGNRVNSKLSLGETCPQTGMMQRTGIFQYLGGDVDGWEARDINNCPLLA